MQTTPDVSFVLPVFKKANVLPDVLRSLENQSLNSPPEYVFVDDASPDDSVSILRQWASRVPNCKIIENVTNAGPSIRLNQGAAAAAGRYLCLIDADELIAPNVVQMMLALLAKEKAQLIHGKVQDSPLPSVAIVPEKVPEEPPYSVTSSPLETVLGKRGFVRMTWVVESRAFHASGGCDERIFVQDESIALRLAGAVERMIDLRATMTYAPHMGSHISSNDAQLLHDRFFAYYNMLQDSRKLDAKQQRMIEKRCISTARKAADRVGLPANRPQIAYVYVRAKLGMGLPKNYDLHALAAAFRALPGVRRPQALPA